MPTRCLVLVSWLVGQRQGLRMQVNGAGLLSLRSAISKVCGGRLRALRLVSSRRGHTRLQGDWSSGVCSSDLHTSEVDDPGFFLAPNGKTDPHAELEATLAKFFSDELVGRSRQPAQCAFVARYHWLKSQLAIEDRKSVV